MLWIDGYHYHYNSNLENNGNQITSRRWRAFKELFKGRKLKHILAKN